jgi:hypothetical protein
MKYYEKTLLWEDPTPNLIPELLAVEFYYSFSNSLLSNPKFEDCRLKNGKKNRVHTDRWMDDRNGFVAEVGKSTPA